MGGKTSTSQSQVQIPPAVLAQYNAATSRAADVSQTPFQTYGGQFVAPTNTEQAQGTSTINASSQPVTGADINNYLSPYLGDVLQSTEALQNQSNQQQQAGQLGDAITSGAFGGDRTGIAAANLEEQQNLANSNVIAGIANQGFNTALGAAQQQQQTGIAGGEAEIGAGTVQQQTQQANDTALYNQFLQQQSYPFQASQFFTNSVEGLGANSGSTTTTTQPGGFFSDRRLKRDIKKIGETFDHQDVITYKMGDDNRTRIGLIAQDVEKKHPEAVGVAGGFKVVDYGKATEKAANQGHFYAGGVVPFRRARAVGGTDDGLAGVLDAQQRMYAGMPGGGVSRQINTGSGGSHSLAVSNAPATAPQTGISQVNQGLGTVNNGYKLYSNMGRPGAGPSTPSGGIVPTSATAQPAALQPAGLQASGVTTAGADAPAATEGALATAAPMDTAVDAGASAAGSAATGAAAGAATDAAVAGGTEAAADAATALAAEYAAADVGALAILAAKRGGAIRRKYDTGGTPYLDASLDSEGNLNIPEDPNTNTLKAAPSAGKQPTGLQSMMKMANPTDWSDMAGSMFSNQALRTGGVAGRRGFDDGGNADMSDSGTLDEVVVPADRDPVYDTVPVPDQTTTGVVAPDASMTGPPVVADATPTGVAGGATSKPSGGGLKEFWENNKGYILPALSAIGAMGTAKTVHPGVALAAGLGAGADSYVSTQEGLAQAQRIKSMAQGQDIQNQIAAMKAGAAHDYLDSGGSSSGVVPRQPVTTDASQPSAGAPAGGGASPIKVATPQSSTPSSAADTAANVDQTYRQKYFVQPGYTPDEQSAMQKALKASIVLGDAQVNTVKQAHENRVQTAQAANRNDAQSEADGLYAQATDPNGDPQMRQAALIKYNAIHQWTDDKYEDNGGQRINSRTGAPAIGIATQQLTPQQQADIQLREAAPVDTGAPAHVPLGQFAGSHGAPLPAVNGAPSAPATPAVTTRPTTVTKPRPVATTTKPAGPDFSAAPDKPAWLDDPNHILTPEQNKIADAYAAKENELREEANGIRQTQQQQVATQRMLNLLPQAKMGPGSSELATMQTMLGNLTGSQFTSWVDSNPAAYQILAKQMGNAAIENTLAKMRSEGASVRLGANESGLIINKLSASPEMAKAAAKSLLGWQSQQLDYEATRQKAIPTYLAQGKDARQFDAVYSPANPLQAAVSTAAPSGTTIAPPHPGQTSTAPVQVKSKAEAMALAPGTIFMTPDGRRKVR